MPTVTGLTAARMLAIEAASVVGGAISANKLILSKYDGSTIDAGVIRGSGFYSVIVDVTNISGVTGSAVGDYFVNADTVNHTILGVTAAPGAIVKATSATAGVASGNIRGATGATGSTGPSGTNGTNGTNGISGAAPYVSSLPGSPTNEQEVTYQNAAMAALGVAWRFKYRSGASGSYKWDFVGGGDYNSPSAGSIYTNSIALVDVTGGPTLTIPLSGDYEIAARATVVPDSPSLCQIGIYNNASGTTNLFLTHSYGWGAPYGRLVATGFGAGQILNVKAANANGISTNFIGPAIAIRPIRVG